jgi:hypothetical protein
MKTRHYSEQALQAFAESARGVHYNKVRDQIGSYDWAGWYPEVTTRGVLTGNIIPADQYGYVVCDVQPCGVVIHEHASDAVVVDNDK